MGVGKVGRVEGRKVGVGKVGRVKGDREVLGG